MVIFNKCIINKLLNFNKKLRQINVVKSIFKTDLRHYKY